MALNISTLGATLGPNSAAQLAALARTNVLHYTADGALRDSGSGEADGLGSLDFSAAGLAGAGKASAAPGTKGGSFEGVPSFEKALLKAIDGVSASQGKSDDLLQRIVADPDSVDAQDVTIAMAEANMSLNLAKTILSRIVTAWKDVINTR
jgi:flagellar hook-basal body complex protein FliE